MSFKARFEMKGLDEYLKKLAQAGKDIDSIVDKALAESAPIVFEAMNEAAPYLTGVVVNHIQMSEPKVSGTFHFIIIELDLRDRRALHGVYHEFGTDKMDAHPWFRPSFDNNRRRVHTVQKRVLEREGAL
jgi:HK97 gp10 family phage protein